MMASTNKVCMASIFLSLAAVLVLSVSAQDPSFEVAPEPEPNVSNTTLSSNSIHANSLLTITSNVSDVSGIASVEAVIENAAGQTIDTITLYDDGNHNDGNGNDGIYGNTWNSSNNMPGVYNVSIKATDKLGNTAIGEETSFEISSRSQTGFKMSYIYLYEPADHIPENFERFENAKPFHQEIFNKAGKGKITLDLSYPIISIEITDSNRDILLYSDFSGIYLESMEIIKEFYKNNPDDFDFVSIYTNFLVGSGASYAYHFNVQNKIEGIGLDIFDRSGEYGSDGRLLGFNYLGNINQRYSQEALEEFTEEELNCMSAIGGLVHETTHQWAAYIGDKYGEDSDLILQNSWGGHWFQGLDLGYDPVGGGKWSDNGDGTFTLLEHDEFCAPQDPDVPSRYGIDKFSDLTLYLIGAIDADQVEPILWVNYNGVLSPGTTVSAESKYITIQDIIARIALEEENIKDMTKYAEKEVFLISDENWKDVLSLVPVTTWTENTEVKKYPTLIYHEEKFKYSGNFNDYSVSYLVFEGGNYWQEFIAEEDNILGIFIPIAAYDEPNQISIDIKDQNGNLIKSSEIISFDTTSLTEIFIPVELRGLTEGGNYKLFINVIEAQGNIYTGKNSNIYTEGISSIGANDDFAFKVKSDSDSVSGFDADSIIYFMQQYSPDKLTIIGGTPQELYNLLISDPELGAGLQQTQIQGTSLDGYLSYWSSYEYVVYVEDDYELALLASTYASLTNAPLIIQGTSLDSDDVFTNRDVICVGSVSRTCNENYNLEQLQQKYVDETNTDKIILVNPNDLDIKVNEEFQPEKSAGEIDEIYSRTSLSAPILASAKHEVILTEKTEDYHEIDLLIESFIKNSDIFDNSFEIETEFICPGSGILGTIAYYNISTGTIKKLPIDCSSKYEPSIYNNILVWGGSDRRSQSSVYDLSSSQRIESPLTKTHSPSIYGNKIVYTDFTDIYLYDLETKIETKITDNDYNKETPEIYENKIVWVDYRNGNKDIYLYDLETGQETQISFSPGIDYSPAVYGNYIVWDSSDSGIQLYDVQTGQTSTISANGGGPEIYENHVVWAEYRNGKVDLFHYNLETDEEAQITDDQAGQSRAQMHDNKIVWMQSETYQPKNIYMCDMSKNGNIGGCLVNDEKTQITDKNVDQYTPTIFNDIAAWEDHGTTNHSIKGYLTIIGSPNAIPYRKFVLRIAGADRYECLDQTHYADLNNDFFPDISTGRIAGITISDVSSYMARDLFNDHIAHSSEDVLVTAMEDAPGETGRFTGKAEPIYYALQNAGYNVDYFVLGSDSSFSINDLENKGLITYFGHGNSYGVYGISSSNMPQLDNSLVSMQACSTCSTYNKDSFCFKAIRNGAIAYYGSVCVSRSTYLYNRNVDGIYYDNLTLGQSYAKAYCTGDGWMSVFLGDPTFHPNPPYLLTEPHLE